jgi:RimJ/RimL family protein N-acetyltransferase
VHNPFLIGDLVYLRPLEREDAPTLEAWVNHPDVSRTIQRCRPMNRQVEETFIDDMTKSDTSVAVGIMARQSDRFVGVTGLHQIDWRNRQAGFGIMVGPDQWGRGYGTEATRLLVKYAFETLNLNRVWLQVYEYNPRGLRSYEKVGFRREGVLRQDNFREGRYWDTIVMAILRQDWPAVPGGA